MYSSLERAIVCKLQEDLPIVPEPYKAIAYELGISEMELLCKITEMKNKKALRRIGAVLHHNSAGFNANAMVVWKVPEERIDEVTELMVTFPQISHCYERVTCCNWDYNIYTMIHCETNDNLMNIIKCLAEAVQIKEYEVLHSLKELKKCSMKYFL
jgi:siroheme decarboxylase